VGVVKHLKDETTKCQYTSDIATLTSEACMEAQRGYMTKQEWKIGDCLGLIKDIPDNSIDLIICDPPYYKIDSSGWDNQWETFEDYIKWLENRSIEMKRVLKEKGSLYMFGDDHRIAYIQVMLDKYFNFLNHLIWYKRNNQSIKGAENARRFACVSERILFYGLQDGTGLQEIHSDKNCFRPIKDYMNGECKKLYDSKGFNTKVELNEFLNEITNTKSVVSRHYFCDSQWVFPTRELYLKLQTTGFFPLPYNDLRNGFDNERSGYDSLKDGYESMRRTYNYQNTYELLDIPIVNKKDNSSHPTTKPIQLIETIIKASSNKGDMVLDCFLGSGTTLEACMNTERNCIGFEISDEWEKHKKKRLVSDNSKLTDTWGCYAPQR